MANWEGCFRSNYFKVKNKKKFTDWVHDLLGESDVQIFDNKEAHPGYVAIGSYSGIPSCPEQEDGTELDFYDELAKHLAKGEVAVIEEVGWEKLRYMSGFATAVSDQGVVAQVDLGDIHAKLKKKGFSNVTECQY